MSLNERQKAFCEYYASCLNATEAAIKAGYKQKTAYAIGSENLKKLEIQKYLHELINREKTDRIATINDVLVYLSNTMRNESELTRERTKAAQCLCNMLTGSSRECDNDSLSITFEVKDLTGGEKLED